MEFLPSAASFAQETDLLAQELAFVILLSLAALAAIIVRRIPLPYTVTLVLIGLALSFVPSVGIDLSSELILAILVPPLIFEATLSIKWRNLRENLAPILLLALVGTFMGTFIVAAIITLVGATFIPELDIILPAAIAFGALISATDPVAVIAFFRSLGVSKRLAVLVEGESLFQRRRCHCHLLNRPYYRRGRRRGNGRSLQRRRRRNRILCASPWVVWQWAASSAIWFQPSFSRTWTII